ncbi:MAG: diaminopimelate decarboxylase [bacterium]
MLQGTMSVGDDDILYIGDVSVKKLVEQFDTPLLVMDEKKIRSNLQEYLESFAQNYPRYRVAYAGKAMLNKALCKILEDEGASLDVVSGGELYTALQADFPVEKIYFHGNNKLESEIELALDNNVGRFVVDNFHEAHLINQLAEKKGHKANCLVRITPGIEAHTHEYIQTGQIDSKFGVGFAEDQALNLIEEIHNSPNLNFVGLHAHIGSQIFEIEPYAKLIEIIFDFCAEIEEKIGVLVDELNLGGGLGIGHIPVEDPPAINDLIETISQKVKNESEKRNYKLPKLIVEPGRSIVGNAGTTLYQVGSIKQVPGLTKYVAVDGGMTDNIRPALYEASYTAIAAEKCSKKPEEEVTIAGKCCESGDILIEGIKLPHLEAGEIIAIPCTGAYTFAMSSNYNKNTKIGVVLVKDGQAREIVKRQSYDHMIQNEVIPQDLI